MNILLVHNYYQFQGGEDTVFALESEMLRNRGHTVHELTMQNVDALSENRTLTAINAVWSLPSYKIIQNYLRQHSLDIVHFHNTFLRISPAAYYACRQSGIPVVQTLHNYRLLCPRADFFRNGDVCEDCLGKTITWPSIKHRCWHGSRIQTAVPTAMLLVHRMLGTWQTQVNVFIALTHFARRKFIAGGLPEDKIFTKPNFVKADSFERSEYAEYALFVGRLSPEKGVRQLLEAWQYLSDIPLKIVGDGPLWEEVHSLKELYKLENVEILGRKSREQVMTLMQKAYCLVFPSLWYEGFPMTIVEAFSAGLPVVAPQLGAMAEIIVDGVTGLHFRPNDFEDFVLKLRYLWNQKQHCTQMGLAARQEYEQKYTEEQNYKALIEIYQTLRPS